MKGNQPKIITLGANHQNQFCQVHALKACVAHFTHATRPLFTDRSGKPVSHKFVPEHLKQAIQLIGLDPALYLGHRVCIGAATEAACNGM